MNQSWRNAGVALISLLGLWWCARAMSDAWASRHAIPPMQSKISPEHAGKSIRVATWNIRCENGDTDAKRQWSRRLSPMVRGFREISPDIFAVQEALHGQISDLWASMPEYEMAGVGRDDGKLAGEFTGIFWRKARFDVDAREISTRWLSDSPEKPGSMTWGNQFPRVVVQLRLIDRVTERGFSVYATHWDHQSPEIKQKSARLMRQWIAARQHPDEPVLILGDFNATIRSASLATLLGSVKTDKSPRDSLALRDVFQTLHPNTTERRTLHFWRGNRSGELDVDHILVSPEWKILSSEIRFFLEPLPSDHFPVWAELENF